MKNWISKNYKLLIIGAFLVPIFTVALVSISHLTKWYGISNPVSWAIYLSIGIEIAALSTLAAISADMGKKVYFPFGLVTLVQFIGNIYFAYSFIDIDSKSFKDWIELVSPMVEFMGVDNTDLVGHKRFLAFFAGGMLPIISLSFLHMLVKFTEEDRKKTQTLEPVVDIEKISREAAIIEAEKELSEKYTPTEEELQKIEEFITKKSKENKINNSDGDNKKTEKTDNEIVNDKKRIKNSKDESEGDSLKNEIKNNSNNEYVHEHEREDISDGDLIHQSTKKEEQNYSTIEPTERSESEEFSTIESKEENIFQENKNIDQVEEIESESNENNFIDREEQKIEEQVQNENIPQSKLIEEEEEKKN